MQRGVKAVPVFWIATEDHDFAEVAMAEFINRDCAIDRVSVPLESHAEGLPVGRVTNPAPNIATEKIRNATTANIIESRIPASNRAAHRCLLPPAPGAGLPAPASLTSCTSLNIEAGR